MLNPTFNLTGRITEPTIHNFEGDYCAVSFSVPTTVNQKNKEGKYEEKTIWYACKSILKKTDGRIPYMKKGVMLLLAVSYEPEEWTEGEQKRSRPVFMVKEFALGPKLAPAENSGTTTNAAPETKSNKKTEEKTPVIEVDEDEIPF